MLKQLFMTTIAATTLGLGGTILVATPVPAAAQSVYQSVPKAYRGTWRLKHATWSAKQNLKLKITARTFKSHFGSYAGKNLGVYRGSQAISVFQIAGGMQVGPYNNLQRTRYQKRPALKWTFNGQSMTYVRVK